MRPLRCIDVDSRYVGMHEAADVFHSFAPCGDHALCAFRRYRIVDIHGSEDFSRNYDSTVWLRSFDLRSGRWIGEERPARGISEDPRLIAVGERAYILSMAAPGQPLNPVLYDVAADRPIGIEVAGWDGAQYGKNWQPFVLDGELHAVHTFSPFRILRIDVETGVARVIFEEPVGLDEPARHDGFTCYRGGGSALVCDGTVRGFGHVTLDPGRHVPFGWRFDLASGEFGISFDLDTRALRGAGYHLVDPTCFFAFEGKRYLGLSCSNRDWFYGQSFASFLFEIDPQPERGRAVSHLPSQSQACGAPSGALSPVLFLRAAELPTQTGRVGSNFERIATAGEDSPGFLSYGPYARLPPGLYQAQVQYASPSPGDSTVGAWDVTVDNGQTPLFEGALMGTCGVLATATASFEIDARQASASLEVRVNYHGVADMRLADLAIRALHSPVSGTLPEIAAWEVSPTSTPLALRAAPLEDAQLKARLARAESLVETLQQELAGLRSSISWRAIELLRRLRRRLRGG